MGEWWIGKDMEGSGRGLILRYYPCICLEGLRKATKILSQDIQVNIAYVFEGTPLNNPRVNQSGRSQVPSI
jgi:hypothetical protein